jgi:hypothetical protein
LEAEFEEEGAGGGRVEEAGEDEDEGFDNFHPGFMAILQGRGLAIGVRWVVFHDEYLWLFAPVISQKPC